MILGVTCKAAAAVTILKIVNFGNYPKTYMQNKPYLYGNYTEMTKEFGNGGNVPLPLQGCLQGPEPTDPILYG